MFCAFSFISVTLLEYKRDYKDIRVFEDVIASSFIAVLSIKSI